ncbi:MAG: SDR family NAD(P)-dependent oxidoreductase [Deinococcota bacterium]
MTKTVVMTGATSGFGVSWLKGIAAQQTHDIYVLARDQHKFQRLLSELPKRQAQRVHFVQCQLDSFSSIQQAAQQLKQTIDHIDVLINNAGVFSGEQRTESQDSIELTFAVNHLAPFLLTNLVIDLLDKSPSARIVNTASFQHFPGVFDWEDLTYQHRKFDAMKAYQQSKLANVVFTLDLARQLKPWGITVNCFDPGIVNTSMTVTSLSPFLKRMYPMLKYLFRTPEKGAETGLYLSLNDALSGQTGGYYRDKKLKRPNKMATSLEVAQKLWEHSEMLVGHQYSL